MTVRSFLRCGSVAVHFGGVHALVGLDLSIESGERVAIVGGNGSGKSTFINVCSGVIAPTSGTIEIDGAVMTDHSPEAFASAGVGRTFQNLRLMEELTVFDNVALGLNPTLRRFLGVPVASRRRIRGQVEVACTDVGLDVPLWRTVSTLSYGQRKRVEIARMLIGEARFMLFDEPTSGVSRTDTPMLAGMLRALASPNRLMIVVEHDLALIEAFASRVVCIDRGQVISDGSFDDVFADVAVRASVLGEGLH